MNSRPVEDGPVIVGFDGSGSGEDALVLARSCARYLGRRMIVVVIHPSPAAISPARVDAEWVADRHRVAEEVVEAARPLLAGLDDGVEVTYRIVASSSAAHGLHDVAEETGAALIVVGSGSAGPAERLFAGSTAERLLSGAVCPIGVAPAGLRDHPPGDLTEIAVAYIDTPESAAALDLATRLALRTSARLRLVTVVAEEAEVLPLAVGRDAERAFLATAREAYQKALDMAIAGLPQQVRATGEIVTGDVVEVLAELAVDVVFCGSRGYGPVRRVLLGGVSSRLVRRARSPLVVVPRAG
jgi:nucleotide-binding universal stress UspA family protein